MAREELLSVNLARKLKKLPTLELEHLNLAIKFLIITTAFITYSSKFLTI